MIFLSSFFSFLILFEIETFILFFIPSPLIPFPFGGSIGRVKLSKKCIGIFRWQTARAEVANFVHAHSLRLRIWHLHGPEIFARGGGWLGTACAQRTTHTHTCNKVYSYYLRFIRQSPSSISILTVHLYNSFSS